MTAFNTVAVASLLMPILLMDGPFLQRASKVVTRVQETQSHATLPITASPFVKGATGIMPEYETVVRLYQPLFAEILQQYANRGHYGILLPSACLEELLS